MTVLTREQDAALMGYIDELVTALRVARPYVHAFAENAPADDGGAEATADLAAIDAALQKSTEST
jgi:hypothetical protein